MTATTPDELPTTIKMWRTVGADEVLKLDLPAGYYEIVLVRTTPKPLAVHPNFPPGFWERVTIDDPAFKRYPIGEPRDIPPLDAE